MTSNETIKIRKLDSKAKAPARHSDGAAGYDLCSLEGGSIQPNQIGRVRTGLSFSISEDLVGVVFGRSGLGLKHGLTVVDTRVYPRNSEELVISVLNTSNSVFEYTAGYRIAQIVFIQTTCMPIEFVEEMDTTLRGESGFGSTGVN
ncbi:Deoxyuridine 5'-triphosphate nucleotidohydrolase [Nosema granulosis]|uniref:Deoxyuridine 5'-triphosphate nucleotidohydrolase n=1 Tax=Nosema granulosis TaxID=83296 RepID=A0A9P6KZ54_9MICR|nr:Deoxyuridine 5'-triphosphate nucleotidohydrolase [Nosema granulosis]